MRTISNKELSMISGGDLDSDLQDMINEAARVAQEWIMNVEFEIATPLFSIGDFHVTYTGSITEGLNTAVSDCLSFGSGAKMGVDFAAVTNATKYNSSPAAVVGCTLGVGAGIVRDLINN